MTKEHRITVHENQQGLLVFNKENSEDLILIGAISNLLGGYEFYPSEFTLPLDQYALETIASHLNQLNEG